MCDVATVLKVKAEQGQPPAWFIQRLLSRIMAFRMVSSLRIQATRATNVTKQKPPGRLLPPWRLIFLERLSGRGRWFPV